MVRCKRDGPTGVRLDHYRALRKEVEQTEAACPQPWFGNTANNTEAQYMLKRRKE